MSKARELAELGAVYDSGALSNRNYNYQWCDAGGAEGHVKHWLLLRASSGTSLTVDRFAHNSCNMYNGSS